MRPLLWLPMGWLACAGQPLHVEATGDVHGVHVSADGALATVELLDHGDALVVRRTLATPTAAVDLSVDLEPGTYRVRVTGEAGQGAATELVVVAEPPIRVELVAVPGQPWVPAVGDIVVPVIGEAEADVLIGVVAGPGHPDAVAWSGGGDIPLAAPGLREVRHVRVSGAGPIAVRVGDAAFRLVPERVDPAVLAASLTVEDLVFPADPDGSADPGRSAWQVTVAAPWWVAFTRWTGLGMRASDPHVPWAWAAARVTNRGDTPVDLMLTLRVTDATGEAPAFRPRLRSADGDTGFVAALLRVPAHGSSFASLPVFVDTPGVTDGEYSVALDVAPLGGGRLATTERRLLVRHGDTSASVGFVGVLVASVGGGVWVTRRLRGWMVSFSTTDLMTIALFGTALFVVGSVSDLLAMGVAAVLGPFSTLLTGLVNDVARTVLLATLLTLLPRGGTLSLAILAGWLGRALTTGGLSALDLVYTGATIALTEGFAWGAGLTRRSDWRDATPFVRWLRLGVAFGGAGVATTLAGLWLNTVLYRLYFADWYIALQVVGPGFLYVWVACGLAVPFAASLREVDA